MTNSLYLVLVVVFVGIITGSTALNCWQEDKMPTGMIGGSKGMMVTCGDKNDVCVHMEWLAQTRPEWRWGSRKDCGKWEETCGEPSNKIRDRFKCWTCSTNMCNASWRMMPNLSILLLPFAMLKMFL